MRFAALVSLAGLLGCTAPASPIEPQVTSGVLRVHVPIVQNRELDLLFVIDNSPAMAGRRDQLQAGLRRIAARLHAFPGGLPDLHVGVVTTDLGTRGGPGQGACAGLGDDGRLRALPGTSTRFLVDVVQPDGAILRNYDGDLGDALARLADVGSAGCAATQPLGAARRALSHEANRGFRRDGAHLALIFIAASDDCSFDDPEFLGDPPSPARCTERAGQLVPVGDFARAFDDLAGDPSKVLVAGALDLGDTCAELPSPTPPPGRLGAFFRERFPNRSLAISLCEPDLARMLDLLLVIARTTLPVSCLERPLLDLDPDAPGTQPACAAWYEFPIGSELLPACDDDATGACYRFAADPESCPFGSATRVEHVRGRRLPGRTDLLLECLSQ